MARQRLHATSNDVLRRGSCRYEYEMPQIHNGCARNNGYGGEVGVRVQACRSGWVEGKPGENIADAGALTRLIEKGLIFYGT